MTRHPWPIAAQRLRWPLPNFTGGGDFDGGSNINDTLGDGRYAAKATGEQNKRTRETDNRTSPLRKGPYGGA